MEADRASTVNLSEQTSRRSVGFAKWGCRAPLLVVATVIIVVCTINFVRHVMSRAPRGPWDAIEVVEAWRSLRGMPVYELTPNGHSTHIYGAIVPWLQGEVFRWVGPNNYSGRLLSLGSGLAMVALLALTLRGDRSLWYSFVAIAMIMSVHPRSGNYFTENRPDMSSLMFSAAGLLLIAVGQEKRRGLSVAVGTVCLVIGFFFKQTAFIFAPVPLISLALRWRKPDRWEMMWAIFPLAVACGVLLSLKLFSPTVYHFMIDVPKAFSLGSGRQTLKIVWVLLFESPLFLVLLGECLLLDPRSLLDDPRVRWICAALVPALPYCAVTTAKIGGTLNSLLPSLILMATFCILRLPRLLKSLSRPSSPLAARVAGGAFVALLLFMTAFPHMTYGNSLLIQYTQFDLEYDKVVALAARLPGKVVCPEDPTIPLYARNDAGLSIFAERDAHTIDGDWPKAIPEQVVAECRRADYLIDLPDYYTDPIHEEAIRAMGFQLVPAGQSKLESYRIWSRHGHKSIADLAQTVMVGAKGESAD